MMASRRTSTFMTLTLMTLMVGMAGGGCAAESEGQSEEPTLGAIAQGIRECPEDTCGSNSPKIETEGFHELNVKGLPNAQGMRLVAAKLGGAVMELSVDKGRLQARSAKTGWRPRTGVQLIGLKLLLEAKVKDVVSIYELELVDYRDLPYAAPQKSTDTTGAYIVEYVNRSGERRNLCSPRPGSSQDLPYDEALGMAPREALFFEGDRVNTERMAIEPVVDRDWFNIGCYGHTLAKLHLTRNSTASSALAYGHEHEHRQAALKMFVGDYCGTGRPFTVSGQPISWRDDSGVMEFYGAPFSLDARWSSKGAVCMVEPRMLYPATEEGAQKFRNIVSQIQAECAVPICTNSDFYDFAGWPVVSANRVF